MSRDDLNNFIHAVEHSFSLRKAIRNCKENQEEILKVAKDHGFKITIKDLQEDSKAEKINSWFKASKIDPIKNWNYNPK